MLHTMTSISSYSVLRNVALTATSSRSFSFFAPTLAGGKGLVKKSLPKVGLKKAAKKSKSFTRKGEGRGATFIGKKAFNLRYALASELPDMGDFMRLHPENYIANNVGRATTFPRSAYQQLQAFGLPRKLDKELATSGAPASVIRQQTIDLVQAMNSAKAGSSKDARYMITGEKGSGKSMLLIQTVAYCLESGWIVLYDPRAATWIDSSAPYTYHAPSKTFHQPTIASNLLANLLTVNAQKLAQIRIEKAMSLGEQQFGSDTRLIDLVRLGSNEKLAVDVLASVLDVLSTQTQFPVLFALDEVHALFQQTTYRAPDYSPIESYSLSAPLLALDYLTGRKSLSHGAILSALSYSIPDVHVPPILLAALDLPSSQPITPYMRYDPHHLAHASSGIKKVEVPFGMNSGEAAGLFEIWARKGWASTRPSDELFMSAFVAAAGNPKEMGRALTYNFWA
ncbi:MAG: 37S ribosomal protein S23 mitochondrial [Tremellales sp. Tagirdzhanova-0007]|nr:MAG: 37S ribosomal protein S23 mitochondrial [Tremellales sp. Tagirdzhanova-0007]